MQMATENSVCGQTASDDTRVVIEVMLVSSGVCGHALHREKNLLHWGPMPINSRGVVGILCFELDLICITLVIYHIESQKTI
jgi:hypothetical protein